MQCQNNIDQAVSESNVIVIEKEVGLNIVEKFSGLVKTICSPLNDNQSWDLILRMLANTQYDEINGSTYSEITGTSLLPPNGKMNLFLPSNPQYQVMVGILFDLNKCRPHYIFEKNSFYKDGLNKNDNIVPPQVTLEKLREIIKLAQEKNMVLDKNDLITALTKEAIVGVFANKNDLLSRLNALAKQYLISCQLNRYVPVFIITPDSGINYYNRENQLSDIGKGLTRSENDSIRILVEKNIDPELKQLVEKEQKQILLNATYPSDIIGEILSHHTLQELWELTNDFKNQARNKQLQSIILKKFENKREKDLDELIKQLEAPINIDNVFKIINEVNLLFNEIERAIFHLCYLDTKGASNLFSIYLYEEKMANSEVVLAFLKYCPKMEIQQKKMLVVHINEDDSPWEHTSEIKVKMYKWSPFVGAVLFANKVITKLIVDNYPHYIKDIAAGLTELSKINAKYKYNCFYTFIEIQNARKIFLEQLTLAHELYYKFTYDDKRLIENNLNKKLNKLTTRSSLYAFYQVQENKLYFNQLRHKKYDNLRQKFFPQIKENTLLSLQKKLSELNIFESDSMFENKEDNLIKPLSQLQKLLENKYNKLKKQNKISETIFFQQSSRKREKLNELDKVIKALDTITSLPGLKLFTESLMLNKQLTGRRSIGLLASDTSQQLTIFYQDTFNRVK